MCCNCCIHLGYNVESILGHILHPFWLHFGVNFESILIHFWAHSGSHFGSILGPILGPFLGPFWCPKVAFRLRPSSNIEKPVWVMNGKRVHCFDSSCSACLSFCLSVYLSVCLYFCLSVCVCLCVSVCLSRLHIFAQRQSLRSRATLASSAPSPRWPHVSIRSNFPRNDNEKSQWECFAIAASKFNTFETDFEFCYTFFIRLIHFGNHFVNMF